MRVLFCGGGSVGHIAPSIAVWESLKAKRPDAQALFVCSRRRDDGMFLAACHLPYRKLTAPKTSLSPALLFFPMLFPLSLIEAFFVLLIFRPAIIFSKGGYVSVPICFVSWLLGIPIVVHESDSVLGRGNRFLLHFTRHLCIGTPAKELENGDIAARKGIMVTATGNPVRAAILRGSRDGGKRVTGFSGNRPILLVIGGSQGAEALNEAVRSHLSTLLTLCDVIHLTGSGKARTGRQHARYFQREFANEDLPDLLAAADLVVSRGGASAIAEFAALGKAVVIVPIPELAQNHQGANARFLEVAQAAIVLPQEKLHDEFLPLVTQLIQNSEKRRELGSRLKTFAPPDAANRIANILLSEVQEKISPP
jgi:UDP-N-acetylglucosamine--N-acetylmuramyl-(pentapeptide) pyrophosphoryl-undecaprenol N-acetylglucosamine transferase